MTRFCLYCRLERKYLHSLTTQIIPVFLTVLLELLAFIVPLEAGGQLLLGTTLLMTQTVVQVRLGGVLPHSSDTDQSPLISKTKSHYILIAIVNN